MNARQPSLTVLYNTDDMTGHLFDAGTVKLPLVTAQRLMDHDARENGDDLAAWFFACLDRHCRGDFGDYGNMNASTVTQAQVRGRASVPANNALAILTGRGNVISHHTTRTAPFYGLSIETVLKDAGDTDFTTMRLSADSPTQQAVDLHPKAESVQ